MRLLIILIFILAGAAIYLFRYFENKRNEKQEREHERKRESFQKLPDIIRKETDKKNENNEP
ncbi:MAG TPA: hypothetical protein PKC72_05645 [Chitinophagaceae bacterium]|nr:hypothetical protein [Chitinophagaceae bacterium]